MGTTLRLLVLAVSPLVTSCASTAVSPVALHELAETEARAEQALELWYGTLDVANAFLASEYRETLPAGRLVSTDSGVTFLTEGRALPIEIRKNGWGTLFTKIGFAAQERSWGFVVGGRGDGPAEFANSFFLDKGGDWHHPVVAADLLLHEITHTYYDLGTVGFWKGLMYYLEAMFLFRYRNHCDERLPYATTEEVRRWARATGAYTVRWNRLPAWAAAG